MRRAVAAFALILAAAHFGAAQDKPPASAAPTPAPAPTPKPLTTEQAADAVLAAVAAKDDAKLKGLASKDDPDPWLVADELCARGKFDAAEAFAKTAPRPDVEKLPSYVVAQRSDPTPEELRTRCRRCAAANDARKFDQALEHLVGADLTRNDVTSLRLEAERARTLTGLWRTDEVISGDEARVARAVRLGWPAQARALSVRTGQALLAAASQMIDAGNSESGIEMARRGAAKARQGSSKQRRGADIVLGALLSSTGHFAEAVRVLEAESGEVHDAQELVRLSWLAMAYQCAGRKAEALRTHDLVIEQAESDAGTLARSLDYSARILAQSGEPDKAETRLERAIVLYRESGEPVGESGALFFLFKIRRAGGRHTDAQPLLERMREVAAAMPEASRIEGLLNVADAHTWLGDHDGASRVLEEAIAVARRLGNDYQFARCLGALGAVLDTAGDRGKAASALEEAIPILRAAGGSESLPEALWRLGAIRSDAKDYAAATRLLDEAIEIAQTSGNRLVAGNALGIRTAVAVHEKDWAKALKLAKEGERLIRGGAHGLSTEAGALVRSRDIWVYTMGRMAALFLGDASEILHFAELARAGSLLEALGGRSVVDEAFVPPALAAERREVEAKEAEAARLLREADAGGVLTKIKACADALRRVRSEALALSARIERELRRASNVVAPEPLSDKEIGKGLADSEVLVVYEHHPLGYYALVVDGTGVRYVELGKGVDVPATIEAASIERDRPPDESALAKLREFFIERLKLPASVSRLIVSPMEPMSFLPFAVLAPEYEIAYVQSGTTLAWLARDKALRGTDVLALGDPKYGGTTQESASATRGAAMRLTPLPATGDEAKGVGTVVLLGEKASEKGLRDALAMRPRWRAVHLAGHGLVDSREPSLSAIALSPTDADDGFLTLREVLAMRVPADLVVLSACETARGKEYKGEGVFGLTSAFMVAGAPRVLCSLWKVDDAATSALMKKFYELWNPKTGKGVSAARALRDAQTFVRSQEKWKHPRYWAAWVLWGLPA